LKSGKSLSREDLFNFCIEKIAKYKIPKHLQILDELPKNDTGKIDRKKLKRL